MVRFGERPVVPRHQADATLSQANPVSGTKYTVLDTIKNARIISIAVKVTWTVQPTPLEIHLTIDGQLITHMLTNPVSALWYYAEIEPATAETTQNLQTTFPSRAFIYEGGSIKVEAETTGGTVSNLDARVKYAKY